MTPDDLRARRIALDLSQSELARCIGVDVVTVSRWELGKAPMPGADGLLLHLALRGIELDAHLAPLIRSLRAGRGPDKGGRRPARRQADAPAGVARTPVAKPRLQPRKSSGM